MTQSQSIKILSLPPILGATVLTAVLLGGVAPAKSQSSSEIETLQEQLNASSPGAQPSQIGQLPTDDTPTQTAPVFPLPSQPEQPSTSEDQAPAATEETAPVESPAVEEATPDTGAPGETPLETAPANAPATEETAPSVPVVPTGEEAPPDDPEDPPAAEEAAPDTGVPGDVPTAPTEGEAPATPSDVPAPAPSPGLPVPSGDIPSGDPGETPAQTPPSGESVESPGAPPQPPTETAEPAAPEPEVLVSEVFVEGVEGDLAINAYEAISTRPGQTTTRSQIQSDINAIFGTGFFSNVRAEPSDTPLGVRVTFFVQPNPTLQAVQVAGNQVLTQEKVDEIFSSQYGKILNLRDLQAGVTRVNTYYKDEGYVLAQVVGVPQVDPNGTVTLQVAEGEVEEIDVRYINEDGEPTKGKTRKFIITREMRTEPGVPLNRNKLQTDLQRVFGLGLFEDVKVALEPGQDPRKVVVNLNVQERSTASFSAGAGFSSRSGFFGTGSFTQSNLGGNNQNLSIQAQAGTREFLFDAGFSDPWIAGDPNHSSYSINIFNRLTLPLVFDEGPIEVDLPNGDTPRVNRLGISGVFNRPFTTDLDNLRQAWTGSVGFRYQRISIRDADLSISPVDELGNALSFSGSGQDDLLTVQLGLGRDLRDDPADPTKGYALRFGVEQSAPIGSGSILMTRLRGSFSYFVPLKLTNFTEGPQALAFNVQAGTILGDLPPYEAFSLGGSSSVRGYGEGDLGSGRSFMQATAEYRFPLINFLGGVGAVLFFDVGSNLGTQSSVPGNPGIVRGKPGVGFGYGIGLRVKTPIGPVRLDYGINDDGDNQFHFGFGQRF
ncbi:BamA/TamA family outer membrane protein [Acaryochloris sp. IP29b_bin.148]|uniref:BamA/TamA family outer membrane protein n=1 Tax=Acaryochloris sp. IP29b_bin.148 TaxID=2969218 RepID=UPI0026336181|nr:BamA/TamA family outer membrane protein [Acaryochloris sp. IP29b_bin.148]